MRWTGDMTPADARSLVQRIEDRQDNPARAERVTLGPGRHTPRAGLCPRFAIIRKANGSVVLGMPSDGWCEPRLRDDRPTVRVYEDKERTREVLADAEPTRTR